MLGRGWAKGLTWGAGLHRQGHRVRAGKQARLATTRHTTHPPLHRAQLKLVIDSIVWAFRHTERNIADTGGGMEGSWLPPHLSKVADGMQT